MKLSLLIGLLLLTTSCDSGGQRKNESQEHNRTIHVEKSESTHRNRLANSLSPYLLQHADNPVDWYEWGEEAFARARNEDKPIFLSIGYAACHWCHVMAHESFENDSIAAFMNEHFVNIKVDREEHPDVDEIYMTAVQMMTGSGGWPMSMFITPDLKPFYGGTYFPPDDRWGRPGFRNILGQIATAYRENREKIDESADKLTDLIQNSSSVSGASQDVSRRFVDQAVIDVSQQFDSVHGGFGSAPKFPPTGQIDLLLRDYYHSGDPKQLKIVTYTLTKMAQGGIFDQVGGGFHRYSTDREWLTPHFEKMLYDNALLTLSLIDCYLASGDDYFAGIAKRTLDWVLTDMVSPEGGCYSTLDADSDGEEGKFYVWKLAEIKALLGNQADLFIEVYNVTESGNFEHSSNILNITTPISKIAKKHGMSTETLEAKLAESHEILLTERNKRIHPGLDDKILSDWNGLMMSAFARAFRAFGDDRYLQTAEGIAKFIRSNMWEDGSLLHSHRDGTSGIEAMLDDHAFLLAGLLDLYQANFDTALLADATKLAGNMVEHFWDGDNGGFYQVADGRTDLITRTKNGHDGAIPSGNGIAAGSLYALYQLTERDYFRKHAEETVRAFATSIERSPASHIRLLAVLDELTTATQQIAIVGETGSDALLGVVNSSYLPGTVLAMGAGSGGEKVALLKDKTVINGHSAAYVCRDFACKAPVTDPEELKKIVLNRTQ